MSACLAFVLGIWGVHQLPVLPFFSTAQYLLALGFLCLLLWRLPTWRWLSFGIVGIVWALYSSQTDLAHTLKPALEGVDITLSGTIVSIPTQRSRYQRFEFAVDAQASGPFPRLIRLAWYQSTIPVKAGQRWQFKVRLKRPRGFMNPGTFDYEGWLFARGIQATGYIRSWEGNQALPAPGFRSTFHRTRQTLYDHLREQTQHLPFAGVLIALALGQRQDLSEAHKALLLTTGTQHLIAISGLHIGMIAAALFFLTRRLWSCFPSACVSLPAQKVAALAGLLGALAYAALAGFSIPTQRALMMVSLVMLSLVAQRWYPARHIFSVTLVSVLLLQPHAVISAGFWLSFSAVAIILLILRGPPSRWPAWMRVQLGLSLGLVPFTLLFFQQVSWVAPLANALAIPVFSVLIVPLVFLAGLLITSVPAVSQLLLWCSDQALQLLWHWLVWLGQWGTLSLPSLAPWMTALAMIGYLYCIVAKGIPLRYLGVLGFGLLFFAKPSRVDEGEIKLTVLDVGQGLAVVVQTHQHTLVFDAGPKFNRSFNAGSAVVVPFLKAKGIQAIDQLMISHGDNDHRGGAQSIVAQLTVKAVSSGEPERLKGINSTACYAGQTWVWDGVVFEVLAPTADNTMTGNNRSCVLRIQSRGQRVLLTGDIEAPVERQLLKIAPEKLAVDLLSVPHHGSLTSSTPAFVAATSPEIAIFSTGYRNRFGFPKATIRQRYQQQHTALYNTASQGAISFTSKADTWTIETYRSHAPGFWHDREVLPASSQNRP